MQATRLFQEIDWRVERAKDEGYHAYFYRLGLKLEYVTKVVIAGALACPADPDARGLIERKIVREGNWKTALDDILATRPIEEAQEVRNDFNQSERPPGWRHQAVHRLLSAGAHIGLEDRNPGKVKLKDFFGVAVEFRNRARGHGAPTHDQMSRACPELARALDLVTTNLRLFGLPWAYLQRQLNGTFRASPLLGDDSPFSYLRSRPADLESGVYVFLGGPIRLNLVHSDTDLTNIYLPNGKYEDITRSFEWLSYSTNDTRDAPLEWPEQDDGAIGNPESSTNKPPDEHRRRKPATREVRVERGGPSSVPTQTRATAQPRQSSRPRLTDRDNPVIDVPPRSPVARNPGVRTATTLPIRLEPPGAAFKEELLRTKEAWITTVYENGDIQVRHWDASRMSERSNVLGNLRSRPEYRNPRWRELGIAAVEVTIDPVVALRLEAAEFDQGRFDLPSAFDRYVLSEGNVKIRLGDHGDMGGGTRRVGGRYASIRVDGGNSLREWFANTGTTSATLVVRVEARDRLALDWAHGRDSGAGRGTPHLALMSSD